MGIWSSDIPTDLPETPYTCGTNLRSRVLFVQGRQIRHFGRELLVHSDGVVRKITARASDPRAKHAGRMQFHGIRSKDRRLTGGIRLVICVAPQMVDSLGRAVQRATPSFNE